MASYLLPEKLEADLTEKIAERHSHYDTTLYFIPVDHLWFGCIMFVYQSCVCVCAKAGRQRGQCHLRMTPSCPQLYL